MSAINTLYWIALILVVIGGLNWLAIGLAGYDVIAAIFGAGSMAATISYIIVGLAAICLIIVAAWRPTARPAV